MLHQLSFRLAYSECDPAGIIYYGAYHPWMERAYSTWSFDQDIRTDELEERHGIRIASRASNVSYERSPQIYDAMRVEMRLGAIGTTSFTIRFDFVDPDTSARYALGLMTMVTMSADERRPVPVPDWLQTALQTAGPAVGVDP